METRRRESPAVERLLATANDLFYAEGIRAVGIDRILAESKVAKSTLYTHFRTKEELVAEYLRRRSDVIRTRVTRGVDAGQRSAGACVLAVFDIFDESFSERGFRGCPFANASAEYPRHEGVQAAIAYDRAWLPALFSRILDPVLGAGPSSDLAAALVQLYDGAIAGAHLDHTDDNAKTAKRTAIVLLDAHQVG